MGDFCLFVSFVILVSIFYNEHIIVLKAKFKVFYFKYKVLKKISLVEWKIDL